MSRSQQIQCTGALDPNQLFRIDTTLWIMMILTIASLQIEQALSLSTTKLSEEFIYYKSTTTTQIIKPFQTLPHVPKF